MRRSNLSLDLCLYPQRRDTLVRYSLYTSEADLSDIMANLTSFGASIDDLENYDGAIRLNLSVPAANMGGFEGGSIAPRMASVGFIGTADTSCNQKRVERRFAGSISLHLEKKSPAEAGP